ncbi:MAG TPA: nitrilase-related carbon-nitrogen hydrolase [Polyangiales bacterium]|nr:nitrilase-related carbon-nitrogen hydrolase [Polyangiales bacterium]
MNTADGWWLSAGLGAASGVALAASRRRPWLGWICLSPLALVILQGQPAPAALAGALTGAFGCFPSVRSRVLRPLLAMGLVPTMANWCALAAALAWLQRELSPAWLLITLPMATVLSSLPLRVLGAPRWLNNLLACSQEPWLAIVHIARLGGDLTVSALLALAGAVPAVLLAGTDTFPAVAVALATVLAAVSFGTWSLRSARARVEQCSRIRVAAIVADADVGDEPVALSAPEHCDVSATVRRYELLVERAAAEGARLLVLPEVCALVDDDGRTRWLETVSRWARAHQLSIVAPFLYIGDRPKNELMLVDPGGIVASYEKQHPGPRIEPPREQRTAIGPHETGSSGGRFAVSTVICVDLDYADLVEPARRGGGILAVPSNDWFDGFEQLHHRTAVWAAVLTGVSVVRATGHGISSIYDGVGRVIAQRSSQGGPGLLLADAPLSASQ